MTQAVVSPRLQTFTAIPIVLILLFMMAFPTSCRTWFASVGQGIPRVLVLVLIMLLMLKFRLSATMMPTVWLVRICRMRSLVLCLCLIGRRRNLIICVQR